MRTLLTSFADAFRGLRQNFLQTFLSMLGVIIGVGALVAMLSLIDGLEKLAREQISAQTSLETMSISANMRSSLDGISVDRDTFARLDRVVLNELIAALPQPAKGQLAVGGAGMGIARDTLRLGITYRAVTLPMLDDKLTLMAGRWPADTLPDVLAKAEVVINAALSRKLTAPDTLLSASLGQDISLLGGEATVVGVATNGEEVDPENSVLGLLLPYSQLPLLPAADGQEGGIQLSFASVEDVLPAQKFVEEWMTKRFVGIEDAVNVNTYSGYLESLGEGFLVFRIIMGFLIGIAVVVGGVGIMNVMVMSVVERTAEIGIRKAIGANRQTIIAQFLSESVALSVIGSILGTLLGIGVALLGGPIMSLFIEDMNFSAVITFNTLFVVGMVAILIGMIFGTYPALRASRLDPVVAIQRV